MKQFTRTIIALFALCLTACQGKMETPEMVMYENPAAASSQGSFRSEETEATVSRGEFLLRQDVLVPEQLAEIGLTWPRAIRYADENSFYLYGFDREKQREGNFLATLARYDTTTQGLTVIFQDYASTDYTERMSVDKINETTELIFTGQAVCQVENGRMTDYMPLSKELLRDPAFNAATKTIAYATQDTLELCLFEVTSSQSVSIYQPPLDENGSVAGMTSLPALSADGQAVLFQKTGLTASLFQSLTACDRAGKVLLETSPLERLSDSLYHAWLKDGFYTMQATDSSADTDTGNASYITRYDATGKQTDTWMLECCIDTQQISSPRNTTISYTIIWTDLSEGIRTGIGVLDFSTGSATRQYTATGTVHAQDLSPSGKKLAWIEDTSVFEGAVNQGETIMAHR